MSCKIGEQCGKHFHNTGYNGSKVWAEIHNIPKKIDCEECSDHADFEFKGLHDHVNAGLQKKPHDVHHYQKWVKEVNDTFQECLADGRCHEHKLD